MSSMKSESNPIVNEVNGLVHIIYVHTGSMKSESNPIVKSNLHKFQTDPQDIKDHYLWGAIKPIQADQQYLS